MNRLQTSAGYHIRTAGPCRGGLASPLGVLGATLLQVACLLPPLTPLVSREDAPAPPFAAERRGLVAGINRARADAGLPPLAYDALLQRVGDLHCAQLIADDVWGHFSLDGVPPYARYLLAGGHGYHRENAASYSSSIGVDPSTLGDILLEGLARMLGERPPDDGHRRTLLSPEATHVGIGVALDGGEVRVTHEVAVEVATAWNAAPAAARPQEPLALAGRLAPPWQAVAVEVLWEPIPPRLSPAESRALGSYRYPPRRTIAYASAAAESRSAGPGAGRLEVRGDGAFAFAWASGPEPGIEVVVIWAHRTPGERMLTAVAASCTVVTRDGVLPPAYARWAALASLPPQHVPTRPVDAVRPGSANRAVTGR